MLDLAKAIIGTVSTWIERHRQRHALGQLDDDQLRDVNITRNEAQREAAQPFWRASRPLSDDQKAATTACANGEIQMIEAIRIGGLQLEFLHSKEDTDGSLDVFRMTVQPNARVPVPHYHETWDETVHGLSGTLTFLVDGREIAISPGDSVFIKRGVVHGFSNPSQEPATCLSILTPGVLGTAYFREIAELVSSGAADPARMKEIMLKHRLIPVPSVA